MNSYSPPTIQPRCAPSDFLFSGALRGAVHGKRFGDNGMVTEEVTRWLQSTEFKLLQKGDRCCCRYHKTVEDDGEYVEK
jgi:hypothetical protein